MKTINRDLPTPNNEIIGSADDKIKMESCALEYSYKINSLMGMEKLFIMSNFSFSTIF